MADNENVNVDQNSVAEGGVEKAALNRRNFLKKSALLSVPVIMTIASGSVWARPRNCTMSGRLSGNLSDTGPECPPAACSPGYWKQTQHLGSWSPTIKYRPGDSFNDAFNLMFDPAFPASATLFQVVNKEVEPNNPPSSCTPHQDQLKEALKQLAFHAVAALQNSLTLRALDYPHSTASVIQIFQQGFAAYKLCNKGEVEAAKNFLEAPYANAHFCPFGND